MQGVGAKRIYLRTRLLQLDLIWVTGWQTVAGTCHTKIMHSLPGFVLWKRPVEGDIAASKNHFIPLSLPSPHSLFMKHTLKMTFLSPCTSGRSQVMQTLAIERLQIQQTKPSAQSKMSSHYSQNVMFRLSTMLTF